MKKILNVLCIAILFLCLTGCGKTSEKTYKLNEEFKYSNSQGEYSIKFTNVETKTVNDGTVAILTFELNNKSVSDTLKKDEWNFLAYDKKGNGLGSYLIATTGTDAEAELGKKGTGQIGYHIDSDANYIKLKYQDDYLDGSSVGIFEIEW